MTALIIIAALIFVILLTVNIPVEAYIRFYGKKADIKVKYLFLCLYPRKEKPPKNPSKKKEGRKKDKPPEGEKPSEGKKTPVLEEDTAADNTEKSPHENISPNDKPADADKSPEKEAKTEKEEKPPLRDRKNAKHDEITAKKEQVSLLLELVIPPLRKFGGKIRIDDVIIDFAAADEDAAKAAISYGRLGAAVYDGISFLRCFVGMSVRSVNVSCLYNTPADKSRYDGECKIRLRPASLINAVLAVGFGYITNKKKYSPVMELIRKD